jgi:eukaryotic-like serine/threonine-protein kinase
LPDLQDQLPGTLHDHYAIQREIGHGGMAVVYLARDLKHDRDVALKVLYPHLAQMLGRERFLREIRVAAQLHHPHLLPLYDSGDANGSLYYVVPYVEGGSLRDRLSREPRIGTATALQLAREVAEALDYAHRHKVVHRDIKPENILLDESHAVVADFGVARAISEAADTQLTGTGLLVGTPTYMSPEQASETPVDGRSDIYSLGCVLFELLTGAPPFTGSVPIAILARRLTEAAPGLGDRGVTASPHLESILARALARSPDDRFATAAEFAEQLALVASDTGGSRSTPSGLQASPQAVSLAVLPFVNLSPDPESEYFSDGMTEELISALTKVKGLRVTARSSAFAFKGKDVDVREIGQKLNVGAVLEGSVRRAGDRLRITAQLIDSADGYYVWSETFDRGMADVFAVQDELSRAITANLRVRLTPGQEPLNEPPTDNIDAYTSYLKGLHHLNRRTVEGYRQSIEFFQAAVAKDPAYALPYAGIAHAYAVLGFDWYGGMAPREARPLAVTAVTRSLELDHNLVEGHTALAMIRMLYEWDWSGTEASFRRAIEINPGHSAAHHWFSLFLSTRGRHEESLKEIKRAHELDPLSIIINQNVARAHHMAGRYQEAIEQFQRTLALEPRFFTTHVMLAQSLAVVGRHHEAMASLRNAESLAGRNALILSELAIVFAETGQQEEARQVLGELTELSRREHVPVYQLALAHYAVGDEAIALDLMEKSYEERSTIIPWMGSGIEWRLVRTHPRIIRLLNQLNVPNASLPA